MKEAGPTRVQIPSRRHAGQTADVTPIERDRALSETLKIRCGDPVTAIRLQHVPVQRIEHTMIAFTSLPAPPSSRLSR